jgi:flavin reductase (DIM6/NTAB) family NADH-FMN oxidoreductase RutF
LVGISFSKDTRPNHERKDSLNNIIETQEFSISIPTEAHKHQIAQSGANLPLGIDEFEFAKVKKSQCPNINAPYVTDAAGMLECGVEEIKTLRGGSTLLIAEARFAHFNETLVYNNQFQSDNLLARLGYREYCAVEQKFDVITSVYKE